jgi:cyclopropane-fatty-acyl-phospholipid synthase
LKFTADVIFPGGLNPRIEELVEACGQSWEIVQLNTRRVRTTARRPPSGCAASARTRRRSWPRAGAQGDVERRDVWTNYDRYLSTCVKAFANHWSSDVQMKLRKKD